MPITKEEEEASLEIQNILDDSKPKHLGQGLVHGGSQIVKGAVGAVGVAILMPVVKAREGHEKHGITGGLVGVVGGAVGGLVHGANVLGGGVVKGVGSMVQGVAAVPEAMTAPRDGKWWNANEGRWVKTNLLEEERWIKTQPKYDEDILGENVIPEDEMTSSAKARQNEKKVKDTYYYDLLGLSPEVESDVIKRRYYIIARKFSPDRCGANPDAQKEFKEIGQAYCILMNKDLRERYDKVGKEHLYDFDVSAEPPEVDPFKLYTFLFGSERFTDYIGTLAAATEIRVGDVKNKSVSPEQARLLQKRRVTRVALKLADRLSKWAEEDMELASKADWMTQAESLCKASYGVELVNVIGKIYSLASLQFLGSLESGVGLPSLSTWAKSNMTQMKETADKLGMKKDGRSMFQKQVGIGFKKAGGDKELEGMAKDAIKDQLQASALDTLWQQTVVDITATILEASKMVLYDQQVSAEVRKKRAEALADLGSIFEKQEPTGIPVPEQLELQELAFNAMLDTAWRQEMYARQAQSHANDS